MFSLSILLLPEQPLSRRIALVLTLLAIVASVALILDRPRAGALFLLIPIALTLISHPRLALYQFIICLFVGYTVIPQIPLTLIDVSALILIVSGAVDFFLRGQQTANSIPLRLYYLALLGAMLISALLAFDISQSVRPLARVFFIFLTFLALVRLAPRVGIWRLLMVFFWTAVGFSVLSVSQYVLSAGVVRSFALAPKVFDDLTMMAFPLGVALSLTCRRSESFWYACGTIITLGALIATQSRAPIIFAALGGLLTVVIFWKYLGGLSALEVKTSSTQRSTRGQKLKRRLLLVSSFALLALASLIALEPETFQAVLGRFERLITTDPSGTVRLRIALWTNALTTFMDHPLFGVGPGGISELDVIYPTLHLDPTRFWVRGLSSHNLFLHYLAETGLLGGVAIMALFVRQFASARKSWQSAVTASRSNFIPSDNIRIGDSLALYVASTLLLVTFLLESGWMWGQTGFLAALFLGLIASSQRTR